MRESERHTEAGLLNDQIAQDCIDDKLEAHAATKSTPPPIRIRAGLARQIRLSVTALRIRASAQSLTPVESDFLRVSCAMGYGSATRKIAAERL